jgi:HAD superfamily hydrolase (TIGR01662 family)
VSVTDGLMRMFSLTMSREECRKIFERSFQTRKFATPQEAYRQLCVDIGVVSDDAYIHDLELLFAQSIASIEVFPHTVAMLTSLKECGHRLGLISNCSMQVVERLREDTRLLDLFDVVLFSCECGMIKPEPGIYELLLQKAGCRPEEAVMVGDSVADDIEPAKKIGMQPIQYTGFEQLKQAFSAMGILV